MDKMSNKDKLLSCVRKHCDLSNENVYECSLNNCLSEIIKTGEDLHKSYEWVLSQMKSKGFGVRSCNYLFAKQLMNTVKKSVDELKKSKKGIHDKKNIERAITLHKAMQSLLNVYIPLVVP